MSKQDLYSRNKLLKHLDRLEEWDRTGFTYPVLGNVNLTNLCSHKCPLCTTLTRDKATIPLEKVKDIIIQLRDIGVKAVGYGGGGDPTCHPDLREIISHTKANGMEIGLTTNGHMMSADLIDTAASCCTWIRISLDADKPAIYKKVHGVPEKAFSQVVGNIEKLVDSKRRSNSSVVIGITYLMGSLTIEGIYNAAKLAADLGVDYIRFRPFFNWAGQVLREEEQRSMMNALNKAKEMENTVFSVSYTEDRCETVTGPRKRKYGKCYIHHFQAFIAPSLKLYPCCMLDGKEKYCLGDLNAGSLEQIWRSEQRKKACERINFADCPNPCMLEKHNELLWSIKQPVPHSAFF